MKVTEGVLVGVEGILVLVNVGVRVEVLVGVRVGVLVLVLVAVAVLVGVGAPLVIVKRTVTVHPFTPRPSLCEKAVAETVPLPSSKPVQVAGLSR